MGRMRKKERVEQIQLIDTTPENKKEILKVARQYKATQSDRVHALAEEKKLKAQLIELIKEAGLKPIDDSGTIRFKIEEVLISITPRDELVQVKEEDAE